MTIALYNYVQPHERNSPGGGVTVYLRNLAKSLEEAGHKVLIISGGDRYDLLRRSPRISHRNDGQLIIYNSPVIAPAIFSFHHPEIYLESRKLDNVAHDLRKKIGEVDVFHFHNIEGLTYNFFLSLRRTFPKSALVFSAHNYNIGCPQVNLWQRRGEACGDFLDGAACVGCSDLPDRRRRKLLVNRLKTPVKNLGERYSFASRIAYRLDPGVKSFFRGEDLSTPECEMTQLRPVDRETISRASYYRAYRKAGIDLVNTVFDRTIGVSRRTSEILLRFGANPNKVVTSYIGTKHADNFGKYARKIPSPSDLHIAFFGYMREEKGFFYFLENLEKLSELLRRQISVTIAAKHTSIQGVRRMEEMAHTFRSFSAHDGYTHDTLPGILSGVNLGVVPPLWEDNLPQVAIEFVAHGIPIITSNMGGAQEIAADPRFVFDISNPLGLAQKLEEIVKGELDMGEFWRRELTIRSNAQHVSEILQVYEEILASKRQ